MMATQKLKILRIFGSYYISLIDNSISSKIRA